MSATSAAVPSARVRLLPQPSSRAHAERGFSLSEMLVASAVFLLVVLAAYQVFDRSNKGYRLGQNQAEMVQSARVAFDQMVNDIRQAGYEFDVDGELTTYPNQPDEALEFMHRRAIVVRANYDFEKELKGREPGLEFTENNVEACCPVVTTANDDIIGYALGKPVGTTQPTDSFTLNFDTTGTADTGDTVVRDAFVIRSGNTAGTIDGEETVTVANFELDALDDPPYVLYRFTFNEDGTVNRMPLIDGIRDLEFTYYDESDTVLVGTQPDGTVVPGTADIWGNDNTQDKEAGRLTRWSIRRIKVTVQTMTPDADLGVLDASNEGSMDDVANYQGKRLFRLEEDIVPPNLGRRGQTDRDINPPEPVRNVEICTGQCGFVRVSWEPGPPEDKIADHIVILCDGECLDNGSNRIASFVTIANYDPVPEPDREYAVFTKEDANGIANGTNVWARVIARNFAGSESECPVTDCPTCCKSQSGAVIGTTTRTESFSNASSSGYDPLDPAWPDAKLDNASGDLIVIDPVNPSYPSPLRITVSLTPPIYTLDRVAGAGSAPYNWTTRGLASGGPEASIACHREESTPEDDTDDPALRTPVENLPRDPGTNNTYVFRVSGSDNWNWGPGVTDPRNFVPGPDNLHDFVALPLSGSTVTYTDEAQHSWHQPAGRDDQYDDRFEETATHFLNPAGGSRPIPRPPQALTPGEVYYYRFRTVDICWNDKATNNNADPPDGENNDDSGLPDAERRKAWSVANQFSNNNVWREKAMSISPFYPPLIPEDDAVDMRDIADQSINDSDDIPAGNNPIAAWAIPGYAVPPTITDGTAYVPPEKPTEFYLAKVNDAGTDLLDVDNNGEHDARIVFNSAKQTAPTEAGVDPLPATYTTYRLYRKRATSMHPSGADMAFDIATGTAITPDYRTMGQRALYNLTLDSTAKGAPSALTSTNLRDIGTDAYPADCPDGTENDGTQCFPYIYRLVTTQCAAFDDGIDTSTGEKSLPSRPFVFPCRLYDQVEAVGVTPGHGIRPASVAVTVDMLDDDGDPDPGCDGDPNDSTDTQLRSARLLAYRYSVPFAGDYIGTSDWVPVTDTSCDVSFDQADIDLALREFGGDARFVVELSDAANNGPATDAGSGGCRVRSDLLGASGDFGTRIIGCDAVCGGNGDTANVFRGTGGSGAQLETAIAAGDPNTIRITIPKNADCDDDPFTLYQLEFEFQHLSGDIPDFLEATIVDGLVGGARNLPDPSGTGNFGDGDANESELFGSDGDMRLRWYQSFCDGAGDCSYPTVRAGTDPLVVDITFEGAACDIVLTAFNFRVAIDPNSDSVPDELLCTNRAAGTDPQPPVAPGLENPDPGSGGRGPADDPAGVCSSCNEDCEVCYCPINQPTNDDSNVATMDTNPTFDLEDGVNGPNDILVLHFEQSGCAADGCDFSITGVTLGVEAIAGRDCSSGSGIPMPTLTGSVDSAKLRHVASGTTITLGWPPAIIDETDCSIRYKWNGISGVSIANGEAFDLIFEFIYAVGEELGAESQIYELGIEMGTPLAQECGGLGDSATACDKATSDDIPLQ